MKIRNARHGTTLAALLCMATTAVQAGGPVPGRYVMTVYSDMAQGRAILDGSPDELIRELAHGKSGEALTLEEGINLCVAYTQAKQVDNARPACDAALATAEHAVSTARRTSSIWRDPAYDARTGQAIALNNRGVLYALTGEHDAAREAFEAALAIRKRTTYAKENLSLLNEDFAAAR